MRGERRRRIGAKSYGVNADGFWIGEFEIDHAEHFVEIAGGEEIEIFAVGIEDGIDAAVEIGGDRGDFFVGERVKINYAIAVLGGFGVDGPLAVGRPIVVGEIGVFALIDLDGLLLVDVDVEEAIRFIGVEEFFAVGRPDGLEAMHGTVGGDANFFAHAVLRHQVDFFFAGAIGEVGDPLAVGRPGDIFFADSRSTSEIANGAFFCGDGVDIAAGAEGGALAVGRKIERSDQLACVGPVFSGEIEVAGKVDGDFLGLLGREIKEVEEAAVLEND